MKRNTREYLEKSLLTDVPNIKNKNLWIWGTGDTAQLYQEGLRRLEGEGFFIEGYIDNEKSKIGKSFCGKPIIAPDEAKGKQDICILICSTQEWVIAEVSSQLKQMAVEWHLIDEVILKLHAKEVLACYDMMYDSRAKEVYAGIVLWRITGEHTDFPIDMEKDYFVTEPFNKASEEEIFVDCGAWRGDSIAAYVQMKNGVFKKAIAFEPDKINYEGLNNQIQELMTKYQLSADKFEVHNCGVGDKSVQGHFMRYEKNNGVGSKFVASESEGNQSIVTLDEYLQEPYTFLKADIESYEYRMLCGARKGVERNQPLLSICIYHNSVDLYSIPLLIKELNPNYKVSVYHHDTTLAGSVLYAWV